MSLGRRGSQRCCSQPVQRCPDALGRRLPACRSLTCSALPPAPSQRLIDIALGVVEATRRIMFPLSSGAPAAREEVRRSGEAAQSAALAARGGCPGEFHI